jgi:hypothetical protein
VGINGMSHGTYYRSGTDGVSEDDYTSSLSGIAGTLYRWGVLGVHGAAAMNAKLKKTIA